MTVEVDIRHNEQVEAGMAICYTCNDGEAKHLAQIHNGYGDEATPLDAGELELITQAANRHDKETKRQHNISIIVYTRAQA